MARYSLTIGVGLIEEADEFYIIKCLNFRDPIGPPLGASRTKHLNIGVTKRLVAAAMQRGNSYLLGQIFGILPVEMPRITSAHRGVRRPMRVEQDNYADGKVNVVVMHPTKDCQMIFEAGQPKIVETDEIGREVFISLLSPNSDPKKFPNVDYWFEHCNWVDADPEAPQFPDNYMERYEKACIWTG